MKRLALAFLIGFGAAYWLTGWQVRVATAHQSELTVSAIQAYKQLDICQVELSKKPTWRLPK